MAATSRLSTVGNQDELLERTAQGRLVVVKADPDEPPVLAPSR